MPAAKLLPALALGLTFLASSAVVTAANVEPDDYPDGTDISTAVPGVTLSNAEGGPITAETCSGASTGSSVFSYNGGCVPWFGLASGAQSDPYDDNAHSTPESVLEARFAPLASQVSIDIVPDDTSDPFAASIYNADGDLLETQSFPGSGVAGQTFTASFSTSGAQIALLVVSGITGDTVDIDNLNFTSQPTEVPVMSFFGLAFMTAGIGLLGMFGLRRKR